MYIYNIHIGTHIHVLYKVTRNDHVFFVGLTQLSQLSQLPARFWTSKVHAPGGAVPRHRKQGLGGGAGAAGERTGLGGLEGLWVWGWSRLERDGFLHSCFLRDDINNLQRECPDDVLHQDLGVPAAAAQPIIPFSSPRLIKRDAKTNNILLDPAKSTQMPRTILSTSSCRNNTFPPFFQGEDSFSS